MSPAQVVRKWVSRFNQADSDGLAALYAPDVVVVPAPGPCRAGDEPRTVAGGQRVVSSRLARGAGRPSARDSNAAAHSNDRARNPRSAGGH